MRVCLGGTFHPFHVGHEALLRRAFEGDEVFVGVTTGELAGRAERTIPDWKVRAEAVEAFAKAAGFQGKLMVRALTDGVGPAATEAYDAIVVSPETVAGAARINQQRTDAGLPPLQVWDVPHVRGADRLPISATAIAAGRIDRDGTRLTPIDVAVGSANPVKVAGAQAAFSTFLPDAAVQGISVPSGVPEQPQGGETLAGARARAVAALDMTGADLSGAFLEASSLSGATLAGANLDDAVFARADLTDANLSGAIVSGANMDELGDIDGSDWTDVIVRKDVNDKMCAKNPQGVNAVTGNPTAMSLFCN